jgi:hypothetical protein
MIELREIKHKKHFVIRTIRNGRVKVFNNWFAPREEYHGELDGQRWAFGLYYTGNRMMDTLYLWGTEDLYWAINDDDKFSELYSWLPNVSDDGVIHWVWWERS